MRELSVYIELNGIQTLVGKISGEQYNDARFRYVREYIEAREAAPISVSLPFQDDYFSTEQTRNFFESLLPEGFSRKAVADWMKADENDYIAILAQLGRECLGAIKIVEGNDDRESGYELLSAERVKALAAEGATKSTEILLETHLSLTGASGKVGLYYNSDNNTWYLPKGDAPSTHIVKQSHVRHKQIVLNEQLCIQTAKRIGIAVPESFIVSNGSQSDQDVLYATPRYDRPLSENKIIDGLKCPYRLHQEDFAQALGIFASDKYEKVPSGYMSRMFDLLRHNSVNPIEDQIALLRIIIFNYLIGNTDCHVKNFALLYSEDLKSKRLAPAYDLVATRVYRTTSNMSFYIGGELDISKINRNNFAISAFEIGLSQKMVLDNFDYVANKLEGAMTEAAEELANKGFDNSISLKNEILKNGGYAFLHM
ncbi:serine/threonine-protein kinase HipA [Pseudobutyrivibrio sp. NOR37]|uniref:Type II toxin-antitoxin system HipA family toxin n=1 Tax=Pseudobutyrivibrio xylanivorans TaxID=185007 RepID=A0A6M0LHE3_PSEXY|nr:MULTISPECIES: HipA domain-containing protein [Pseudobutyrivibrio]NEX01856.1 type II toxin-antitoxin system HipA family toxin [Pseudobutyrivibrio xylanivorans]SFR72277.1 serine/threonine-protein kinase HipA [Pseudobutyrivibrio sp. NOR37]